VVGGQRNLLLPITDHRPLTTEEMIYKIAQKEFTEMWRDGRFRFVGAFVLILLAATLLAGWTHYKKATEEQAAARATDEQQWQSQGARNPHSAAHFGKYAFKPRTPVSLLDNGVNSYLGVAVWLEAHYQNPFRYRPAEDSTVVQRFGELTAVIVLQLLIPLFIILLAFPAFAGERESGTLRQLLSLGVDRKTLAFGKALGISGALMALLIPAAIIGTAALALAASGSSGDGVSSSFGRFAVMVVSYLLYFTIFLAVSLAASAYFKTAQMALLVLFGFWIFNGLFVPRVAADIAQKVYPAVSSTEFWENTSKDLKEGIDGHDPQNKRTEEAKKQLLAQYNVEKIEDLPINFSGWSLNQGEEYAARVYDKHYSALWQTFENQNRFYNLSSIFAPVLAVKSVSMNMAGTDFAHHRHFATEAEEYRRVINRILNEDYMNNSRTGDTNYVADDTLWSSMPQFQYELPGTAWALQTQVLPLVMLLLWTLLAIALAIFAVKRVRV
jgi:ABC-2 type transport system permease protein